MNDESARSAVPANPRKPRVLLTSAGSLLGRSIMDSLKDRRDGLVLIAGDADPSAPALDECDEGVVLPSSDAPDFGAVVDELCRERGIDLVIPGRDPDVVALSALSDDPESAVRVLGPSSHLVRQARDKWLTAQWCAEAGIPFAPTVCTDSPDIDAELEELIGEWGLPLVCKPRDGSGSLGVTILTTPGQVSVAAKRPGFVIQPYLDPPLPARLEIDQSAGVPLFWEVPTTEPLVAGAIGPDGELGPMVCCEVDHRLGRVERVRLRHDPALLEFGELVVGRAVEAGWRGPVNFPCRIGPDGLMAIELNARFTGSSSSRLMLGQDEVRWLVNRWLSADVIPAYQGPVTDEVVRTFTQYPASAVREAQGSSTG